MGSLRSSAPDHWLTHLATESLAEFGSNHPMRLRLGPSRPLHGTVTLGRCGRFGPRGGHSVTPSGDEPGWQGPGVKVPLRRFATLTPSAWVTALSPLAAIPSCLTEQSWPPSPTSTNSS